MTIQSITGCYGSEPITKEGLSGYYNTSLVDTDHSLDGNANTSEPLKIHNLGLHRCKTKIIHLRYIKTIY